ncbi:TPA: hypothetical protein ACUMEQ_001563, partial [Haemophilus influenzae]
MVKINIILSFIDKQGGCIQPFKMRKKRNRDLAGKFGIKWDGNRMNRGLRESSPFFISRKKKNNEMGKILRK